MLVKSVFKVISVYETKFACKNFGYERGEEPIFQVRGGEKKGGGTKIFPKSKGGNQSLTHYDELTYLLTLHVTNSVSLY